MLGGRVRDSKGARSNQVRWLIKEDGEGLLNLLLKNNLCDDQNCRDTQDSPEEENISLPPPGTCLILSLEPHLDCTRL